MTARTRRAAPKPKRNNTKVLRDANGHWLKGTPPPNPAGAPKRGESWAEVIKRFGEMTAGEAAEMSLELAKKFLSIGEGVTLKQAVVLRVYGALLFDPDARLLNAFMDRAEGKVTQSITVDDITHKQDSELVDEFTDIIHTARARAGAGDSGGTAAAGTGLDAASTDPGGVA